MPITPFPERVLPRKLCNSNEAINSTIALAKLLRLSEYLYDNDAQVDVSLIFDRDTAGYCYISGSVKADVRMQCQRCLEATAVKLSSDFSVKVAESEKQLEKIAQSSADPLEKLEVVLCEEGELDLLSVVEDEMIMCLPIVVSHDNAQCSENLNALQQEALESQESKQSKGSIEGLEMLEKLKQELQQTNKKTNT